jgi:hypothetical protein
MGFFRPFSLEIYGRVLKLPILLLTALFGTAKFIDSLGLEPNTGTFVTLVIGADMFLIGLAMLEIDGIIKAWKAVSRKKP